MRGPERQYPAWLLVLSAVVFAVVGTGVVVELYSRGTLPFAGPFVVIALAPLLVLLRHGVVVRRVRSRRRRFAVALGVLSRLAADERNLPREQRASAATDRSLVEAEHVARSSAELLAANRADAVALVGQLGPLCAQWQPGAPLTRARLDVAEAARKLSLAWNEAREVQTSQ